MQECMIKSDLRKTFCSWIDEKIVPRPPPPVNCLLLGHREEENEYLLLTSMNGLVSYQSERSQSETTFSTPPRLFVFINFRY